MPNLSRRTDKNPPERRTADRASEATHDERARARMDQPRELRRRLIRRGPQREDRFGVFAEAFARFMGTARFLIWMTIFVTVWIVWNVLPWHLSFDHYPFILLTLMLSLQASYAAPLILLAQNRQEARDRVVAEQDRQADAASHADLEFLAREVASLRMAIGEVATRDYLRSEMRALLAGLDERANADERETGSDPEPEQGEDHVPGRRIDD